MSANGDIDCHVGMIGLAVMGSNLIRNIERNGFPCAVFNRSYEVTEAFIKNYPGKFTPAKTLADFVKALKAPRQIFMMVKAGQAVDDLMANLIPLLSAGDILIDGGNTYYKDTLRREKLCTDKGINFLGVGISGGEEGALNGPSIMPGGPKSAWEIVAPMLAKISAKIGGEPCTAYIGPDGAGHYVKMVHNGIEYGDMQLIAEAYCLLRSLAGLSNPELASVFERWNQGVLQSFLIEITSKIFRKKDDETGKALVDVILDAAEQKGTGKWTAQEALDLAVPIPTLAAAVDARVLSSLKTERTAAEKEFPTRVKPNIGNRDAIVNSIHDALYASKIIAYAQGMALLRIASTTYKWNLHLDQIAALWRGGCIIRARFLDEITKAFRGNPELPNLMLASGMKAEITKALPGLRTCVAQGAAAGLALPAFSSALAYFDSYTTAESPLNLTQAQRDFFGAHTFKRTDKPGVFHANWE